MITCTRKVEFDAAHRILNHESKCRTLHGHRYVVEITARPIDGLDGLGRVVDFSVIKGEVGKWLDDNWDHTTVIHKDDPLLGALQSDPMALKPPYVVDWNPTAENMAKFLQQKSTDLLGEYNIEVVRVRVYETPNCYSEATGV
jgi:6-pyruvoyltetrahydropterin/6-carboxytetrahydropterin synthase